MRKQMVKAYSGGMTIGTRKRLAKAITIMSQAIKPGWRHNPVSDRMEYHKFSFITLTVSDAKNITARQGYDLLLSHFLDWMTRTAAKKDPTAKTYVWKAELQKRGQLHYHITTPAWIHWREIRDKWNELQHKAGLLNAYAAEHGHFDPNSTDIHNTKSVRKADLYMIKELCKSISAVQLEAIEEVRKKVAAGLLPEEQEEEEIKKITAEKIKTIGRIWGCSEDLLGVNYFTLSVTRDHERQIDEWVKQGLARRKVDDFFSIVYCDGVDPPEILSKKEQSNFREYLKKSMDRGEPPNVVPEYCVQMELVDVTTSYTWDQLALHFN